MLPTKYWYFAVKRAVEVANLFPVKLDGALTTPYETVYQHKPGYRTLIPLFSTAYIKQHRSQGQDLTSWTSKSLKCVLVGTCSKSNGLLFYHPPSKQIFTCGDGFRLDTCSPAGPQFCQHYSGDSVFTNRSAQEQIHLKPCHENNSTAFCKDEEDLIKEVIVLEAPINESTEPYTVQGKSSGSIFQVFHEDLLDHNPTSNPQELQDKQNIPFPNSHGLSMKQKLLSIY